MKLRMLCVLAVGVLLAADDAKDAAKKDQEKMAGEWSLVSAERDGQPLPEELVKTIKRVFKGDEYTTTKDGDVIGKAKFKLDPSKKPKHIDFTPSEGAEAGQALEGIYELDGDKLKICYSQSGEKRPGEFSTKEGSGRTLGVWKRDKP
jgi:uncharacterized protein (TIGR03067 family)